MENHKYIIDISIQTILNKENISNSLFCLKTKRRVESSLWEMIKKYITDITECIEIIT